MASEKHGGYRQGPARRTVPKTIDLSPGEVRVSGGEAEALSAAGEELAHASDQAGTPDQEQAADPAIEPAIEPASEPAIAPLGEPSGDPAMTGQEAGAQSGDGSRGEDNASGPDPAPRRKSRLRFALPAAAGIVLAVAVLGGLYRTGFLPGIEPVADPVRQPTEPAASGQQVQIDAFSARFAALERELAALRAAPGASAPQIEKLGGEIREYSSRLSKAEQALKTLEAKPQATVAAGQLQSLEQRLAAAEKAIAEPGRGEIGQGAGSGAPALEAALAKLAERNDALEARIGALENGLQARANAADAERETQAAVARASIAGALKSAFERGEPFSELLASAEALTGAGPAVANLRAHAAKGVATAATLQNSFLAAMDEVDAALQPQPEGVVAQLLANAKSLIRVRPSGPQPGDSTEAILSRIEAALASGRLDAALGEWEKLPAIAKPALQDWAGHLSERIDAGQYLGELLGLLGANKAG